MKKDHVHLQHVRRAGFCLVGARKRAKMLGIDWRRLAKEGLPISELEKIDDGPTKSVVRVAKEDQNGR